MPSVLIYQLKAANNRISDEWKICLDTTVLFTDPRLVQTLRNKKLSQTENQLLTDFARPPPGWHTYFILNPEELPGPDMIVALDTEFVCLEQLEIQINSNGQRETIRPMSHALARVSVVRGSGADEGEPFIDDYIAINEPVVDYLTLYSGITPEDLDPNTSRHNLISLKAAYKKLWVLLNLGCSFLGHGLRQDFRVINIQVLKSQIIDTIELLFYTLRVGFASCHYRSWLGIY
jgi:PAB-dependent poly(A)-specific ribonuclease subunit 2